MDANANAIWKVKWREVTPVMNANANANAVWRVKW